MCWELNPGSWQSTGVLSAETTLQEDGDYLKEFSKSQVPREIITLFILFQLDFWILRHMRTMYLLLNNALYTFAFGIL